MDRSRRYPLPATWRRLSGGASQRLNRGPVRVVASGSGSRHRASQCSRFHPITLVFQGPICLCLSRWVQSCLLASWLAVVSAASPTSCLAYVVLKLAGALARLAPTASLRTSVLAASLTAACYPSATSRYGQDSAAEIGPLRRPVSYVSPRDRAELPTPGTVAGRLIVEAQGSRWCGWSAWERSTYSVGALPIWSGDRGLLSTGLPA